MTLDTGGIQMTHSPQDTTKDMEYQAACAHSIESDNDSQPSDYYETDEDAENESEGSEYSDDEDLQDGNPENYNGFSNPELYTIYEEDSNGNACEKSIPQNTLAQDQCTLSGTEAIQPEAITQIESAEIHTIYKKDTNGKPSDNILPKYTMLHNQNIASEPIPSQPTPIPQIYTTTPSPTKPPSKLRTFTSKAKAHMRDEENRKKAMKMFQQGLNEAKMIKAEFDAMDKGKAGSRGVLGKGNGNGKKLAKVCVRVAMERLAK